MTRAKFSVGSVKQTIGREGEIYNLEVELYAVIGNSEENKNFWQATPNGYIKMTINNKEIYDFFKPGRVMYVDFIEAS